MTFVEATTLDAEGLPQYMVDKLTKYQLHLASIVSQGYGSASVMSGHYSGVQVQFSEFVPYAIFTRVKNFSVKNPCM